MALYFVTEVKGLPPDSPADPKVYDMSSGAHAAERYRREEMYSGATYVIVALLDDLEIFGGTFPEVS
jgi:hypothetical protein